MENKNYLQKGMPRSVDIANIHMRAPRTVGHFMEFHSSGKSKHITWRYFAYCRSAINKKTRQLLTSLYIQHKSTYIGYDDRKFGALCFFCTTYNISMLSVYFHTIIKGAQIRKIPKNEALRQTGTWKTINNKTPVNHTSVAASLSNYTNAKLTFKCLCCQWWQCHPTRRGSILM